MSKIINKGSGAGGAKTNYNGLKFEEKTSFEIKLNELKYNKKEIIINKRIGIYYEYINENKNIIYFKKNGFKLYFEKMYNIITYRQPDEAFLILDNNKYYLKILEKKNQNVEGSVEEKLKTGAFNKKEYDLMLNIYSEYKFNISYSFCVSKFLQDKLESNNIKYINIKKIMELDNIIILYGDEEDYFDNLYKWINNINMI